MFDRFTKEASAVLMRADRQAKRLGAPTIEAEHLLLAIAEYPVGPGGQALAQYEITEQRVRSAVDEEFADAVAIGGVKPPANRTPSSKTKWGPSARLAIERGVTESVYRGEKKVKTEQLLLGVIMAEAGVIPRVLQRLGVKAEDLKQAMLPVGAR